MIESDLAYVLVCVGCCMCVRCALYYVSWVVLYSNYDSKKLKKVSYILL
jgi:hypothetical protein